MKTLDELLDRYAQLVGELALVRAEIHQLARIPAVELPAPTVPPSQLRRKPGPKPKAPQAAPTVGVGKRPSKVSDAALAAMRTFPELTMLPALDIFNKAQPPGERWNYDSFKAVLGRLADAGQIIRVRHGIYRLHAQHELNPDGQGVPL